MNRREFLRGLAGTAAALAIVPYVDPETLLPVRRYWTGVDPPAVASAPFRERRFSEPWGSGTIVEFDCEAPCETPSSLYTSPGALFTVAGMSLVHPPRPT